MHIASLVSPAELSAYLIVIEHHFEAASLVCCAAIGLVMAWRGRQPSTSR